MVNGTRDMEYVNTVEAHDAEDAVRKVMDSQGRTGTANDSARVRYTDADYAAVPINNIHYVGVE